MNQEEHRLEQKWLQKKLISLTILLAVLQAGPSAGSQCSGRGRRARNPEGNPHRKGVQLHTGLPLVQAAGIRQSIGMRCFGQKAGRNLTKE